MSSEPIRFPKGWRDATVNDIKGTSHQSIAIGPFGSRMKSDQYLPTGVPVIRGNNLSDTPGFIGDFVYVSPVTADELRSSNVFSLDLVFPHRGAIGAVGIVPHQSDVERWMMSTSLMKLTCDLAVADPRFVFYFFRSSVGRDRLLAHASNVGTPGIAQPLTSLKSVRIPMPPLPTQRKIAAVLSAYDDLIENNNRRIKLLEEMAQRIYREWFVDFRYPGHDNVPLVDSEFGPIPEGWAVHRLGDAVEFVYGKVLKLDARRGGAVTVFGSGGVIGRHNKALAEGPGIIVGRKGNVGAVYWSDGAFFAIDTTYWIRSCVPLTYCYYALCDMEFLDSHAAVPGLSREQAYSLPLVVPDSKIVASFDAIALELFTLRRRIADAIDNLRTTRDLLLPRLISGEIDVADLNIAMPEAAA